MNLRRVNVSLRLLITSCAALMFAGGAALAEGCGGSNSVDLNSGQDGAADGAGGGEGGASDGGGGSSDGGGGGTDGSPVLVGDSSLPDDAGPGGNTSSINCGASSCGIPAQSCCVYSAKNGPPDFLYQCAVGAGCPSDAGAATQTGGDPTAMKCGSQANCPSGTVCCVDFVGNSASSQCQAACTGPQGQLCDPSLGAGAGCGDAGPCGNGNIGDWGLPNTYGTCNNKGH